MLIFVYGTLLSELPLSHTLDNAEFLGKAVAGGVQLYNLGYYPGIKYGDGAVIGEIYSVNNETLQTLDTVEGFDSTNISNSLYHRSEIRIIAPTIATDVFAYYYNLQVDESMLIDSGDYRNFLQFETVA